MLWLDSVSFLKIWEAYVTSTPDENSSSYHFGCLIQLYPNKCCGFPQFGAFWGTCCSVSQSCPTLCDPMDCSIPGSSTILHWPPLPPRVHSSSCSLSQWCSLTISSSAAPFSFYLQFYSSVSGSLCCKISCQHKLIYFPHSHWITVFFFLKKFLFKITYSVHPYDWEKNILNRKYLFTFSKWYLLE